MTWLYVPEISSPFVPALADLNSGSVWLCRRLARYATWRGKSQPPRAWWRRWKQGGFIRRLSGLTCSPSTLDRGVASFISSLRETPARTTALPESGLDRTAIASSRPRSSGSPASAGLILSSARTCRGTPASSLQPSSRHWKDWATALRLEYAARQKPEIPCGASDCSSWPGPDATNRVRDEETLAKCADFRMRNAGQKTAPLYLAEVAQQWHAPRANDPEKRGQIANDPRNGIAGQAENWSSPKASDPEKAGPNMRGSKGDVPLPGQAANWPAPAARDHKGSSENSLTRQDGKTRNDMLDYAAEQFFHPPSSLGQPIAGGSISSTAGPNSNQPSVKRKLNPIFVEALMRWPTGLSGFERQEMAWTLWWRRMPSFVSALVSQKPERQGTLL